MRPLSKVLNSICYHSAPKKVSKVHKEYCMNLSANRFCKTSWRGTTEATS